MLRVALQKLHQSTDAENRRVILNLTEKNRLAKLLDCGCGDGTFTRVLGERIGTSELYGIEIMGKLIGQSERNGLNVYQADLNEPFPIESGSFDVIHANQVLEHLINTDGFVRETYRILKVRGYALISVPNLAAWHNVFCLFCGLKPPAVTVSDETNAGDIYHARLRNAKTIKDKHSVHRRLFTYGAFRELLQYHGFKVEKIIGVGYYPLPVWLSRPASRLDPRHAAYLTLKARKV